MSYRTRPSIYFTRSESSGVRIAGEIYPLRAVPNSEEARDLLKMHLSRSRLIGLIENVQWYAVEQEGQTSPVPPCKVYGATPKEYAGQWQGTFPFKATIEK